MNIKNVSDIFNEEFYIFINDDHSDYVNKLFKFASKYPELSEALYERQDLLKTTIAKRIMVSTNEDNIYDMSSYNHDNAYNILSNINNYLFSMKPYDAFDILLKGDLDLLIDTSSNYVNKVKEEIKSKVEYIQNTNNIEREYFEIFNQCLEDIIDYLEEDFDITFIYSTMNTDLTGKEKGMLLVDLDAYVNDLAMEADIISKFPSEARAYIAYKLNKVWEDPFSMDVINAAANICKSLLLNYTLLSLYSDTPSNIKISNDTLKSIMLEVENGTVSKDDFEGNIVNGPIKFNDNELSYINDYFVNSIFKDDNKKAMTKGDLIDIVR